MITGSVGHENEEDNISVKSQKDCKHLKIDKNGVCLSCKFNVP